MIKKLTLPSGLPYKQVLEIQKSEFDARILLRKHRLQLPDDLIIFVEHSPVFTIGRHGDISNLLNTGSGLSGADIECFKIDRGGDITYHGPGQLTVYPIIDMLRYSLGVKEYVNLLEEAVILTLNSYGIIGERIEGRTGVWIDKGKNDERKISAIGVKCSRFITMHGLSFNIGFNLGGFSGIIPCGIKDRGVTSLSVELGREIEVKEAADRLWQYLTLLLQLRILSQGNS